MSAFSENLIESLREPAIWPDAPETVRIIETHISWVLLTREFAWKIKKPVRFDFLDFSTLEKRKHFCEEELRLNRRTAAELYLDVVPICGTAEVPVIGGSDEPIEFAVRMRRFDDACLLARIVADRKLDASLTDALAERVAAFHLAIPAAAGTSPHGRPEDIRNDALANFDMIAQLERDHPEHGSGPELAATIRRLRDWTQTEGQRLATVFGQRRRDGFVRECHGDLHLGNIVVLENGPCLFDCIEFNAGFRWSDVISEIAFLVMDLEEHGQATAARRLLNRYLERTGDYGGLAVLRFYLVYRAMVRAKIDGIRLADRSQPGRLRRRLRREFGTYLSVADHDAEPATPALIIMHGRSGSGKSHIAGQIVEHSPAVRIRSDIERKRLAGLEETERASGRAAAALYSQAASIRTYERLESLAETVIAAGFPVVVDAAFLQPGQRARFRHLAERLAVPFLIVACEAPADVLRDRVARRQAADSDASDAGQDVLQQQLRMDTEMTSEPAARIVIDTSDDHSMAHGLQRVFELLK